jgi:hypothetical protein
VGDRPLHFALKQLDLCLWGDLCAQGFGAPSENNKCIAKGSFTTRRQL